MGTQEVGEDIPLALACAGHLGTWEASQSVCFGPATHWLMGQAQVKFKVQFKSLESTAPPSCGVTRRV